MHASRRFFFRFPSCRNVHCCVGGTSLCSATVVKFTCLRRRRIAAATVTTISISITTTYINTITITTITTTKYYRILKLLPLSTKFAAMYLLINTLFNQVSDGVVQACRPRYRIIMKGDRYSGVGRKKMLIDHNIFYSPKKEQS